MPNEKLKLDKNDPLHKSLFEDVLSFNKTTRLAPNQLIIFCTESNDKMFIGDSLKGFSHAKFCNKSNHIQTDVGICVASNAIQSWHEGGVKLLQSEMSLNHDKMNENLRHAEHIYSLNLDKFANLNFKVHH